MQTMNISLPDPMKEFVDQQVTAGGYSSVSEYIRGLIREDEKRRWQERLEGLLMEGLESGNPVEWTPELRAEIRAQAVKSVQQRTRHRPS